VKRHAVAEPAMQNGAPRSGEPARRARQTGEPAERA
jgi:hypothetical protein